MLNELLFDVFKDDEAFLNAVRNDDVIDVQIIMRAYGSTNHTIGAALSLLDYAIEKIKDINE